MMVLHKVIGSVTHEITLPDNVAKQMLDKHPGVYVIAAVKPDEKKDEPVQINVSNECAKVNAEALAKVVTAKPRGRRRS